MCNLIRGRLALRLGRLHGLVVAMVVSYALACVGCSERTRSNGQKIPSNDVQIITESFDNMLGMSFQYVPLGEFAMGTVPDGGQQLIPEVYLRFEKPRNVQIDQGFYLQMTEVTNKQFQQFVDATGYDGGEQGKEDFLRHFHDPQYTAFREAEKPVVFVSWHDAVAFCKWLSKVDGRSYRLPTEEEWEYVCRAGGDQSFCSSVEKHLDEYAWFKGNAREHPHQVAEKKGNPWNVHDMLGNVWEWTSSSFPEDIAKESGLGREVIHIRGGSFANSASACRCATRWAGWPPSKRSRTVGFRVLCDL